MLKVSLECLDTGTPFVKFKNSPPRIIILLIFAIYAIFSVFAGIRGLLLFCTFIGFSLAYDFL